MRERQNTPEERGAVYPNIVELDAIKVQEHLVALDEAVHALGVLANRCRLMLRQGLRQGIQALFPNREEPLDVSMVALKEIIVTAPVAVDHLNKVTIRDALNLVRVKF